MTDNDLSTSGSLQPASLDMGMRVRLSIMMFLQYAVWGSWFSVLAKYLLEIKFDGGQIGEMYGTIAIASIFSPLLFGQIADRWVPTQYLLAGLHLVGAVMLYFMTQYTVFSSLYPCTLIYALLYMPTLSLSNALAMHHVPNVGRDFPGVRVLGTIGWIVSGLYVGYQLQEASTDPLRLALVLSVITAVYCLLLPHTPPRGVAGEALPFIRALGLLKDKTFALFVFVSFIIAVVLAGYFAFTALYLEDVGKALNVDRFKNSAAAVMTIGQFTEMLLLPLLPLLLKRFGMKRTLMLGMAAWGVRYAMFSVGHPAALIVVAIAMHGICYDFFFVAAYIHVDNNAGKEIRASAQALFNLVVMGLGMYLGNKFFGWLFDHYTTDAGTDWSKLWAAPLIGAGVALLIFLVGFKDKKPAAA